MANTKVTSFSVQGNRYGLEPDLTFDTTPTAGSTNPVTSNGIYMAISAASIGTDISVGRADGSQIGYCSIAYGSNIIASADYSIVFGEDNKSFSKYSIVSGSSLHSYGYHGGSGVGFSSSNIVFGRNSYVCGNFSGSIGDYNKLGTSIKSVTAYTPESNETLSGYFDPELGKLYYDETHRIEHEITFDNQWNTGSLYIVDLTKDLPTRVPGDIYMYERLGTAQNPRITIKKMDRRYVKFTDMCHNLTYVHMGVCYYDSAHDKNYRNYYLDPQTEEPVYDDEILDIEVGYGMVFFDLISNRFVLYCGNTASSYPLDCPKWLKIRTYKGFTATPEQDKYGRFAYVYSSTDNTAKTWHVYSSPNYEDSADLTAQLLDGEIVIDISTGKGYLYRYNYDHILSYVKDAFTGGTNDTVWYSHAVATTSSLCLGSSNYTTGQGGSIVCGKNNKVTRNSEGSAVVGLNNTLEIGAGYSQGASFMAGHDNIAKSISSSTHSIFIIGDTNHYTIYDSNDRNYMFGYNNKLEGESTFDTFIMGTDNEQLSIRDSFISGYYNKTFYRSRINVVGRNNEISHLAGYNSNSGEFYNFDYVRVDVDEEGRYTGDGITYDAVNDVYTFPTNTIFRVYEIQPMSTTTTYGDDRSTNNYSYYAVSTDTRTLTHINFSAEETYTHIYGTDNKVIPIKKNESGNYYSGNRYCYIIGYNNLLRSGNAEAVGLIGRGLSVTFNPQMSYDVHPTCNGAVYVGSYNTMNGVTEGGNANKGQFVVGIGTGENDRKNGFIVFTNGNVMAPNAPSSYAALQSTGYRGNVDKSLATWEQIKTYTITPGKTGKPMTGSVSLKGTPGTSGEMNKWVLNGQVYEQTVTLAGSYTTSVILTFPDGDPHAYYTDEIYYINQPEDGKIKFGCSTLPSVDIQVKVVYWP